MGRGTRTSKKTQNLIEGQNLPRCLTASRVFNCLANNWCPEGVYYASYYFFFLNIQKTRGGEAVLYKYIIYCD